MKTVRKYYIGTVNNISLEAVQEGSRFILRCRCEKCNYIMYSQYSVTIDFIFTLYKDKELVEEYINKIMPYCRRGCNKED